MILLLYVRDPADRAIQKDIRDRLIVDSYPNAARALKVL